ncbi:hypothetical protein R6Q59_028648 [Mikania micrantha]
MFENRSNVDMEVRVFVPPDRPDRYWMIVRVKTGQTHKVFTKSLCNWEEYFTFETDNHIFLEIFMDGVYTGVTLLPWEVKKYTKIIGYYGGVRFVFTSFFILK